jgi:hypothetical protein
MGHLLQAAVAKSDGDVISGLRHPVAAELDYPVLQSHCRSSAAHWRLLLGRKYVLNTLTGNCS